MTFNELKAKFEQFLSQNNGKPVIILPGSIKTKHGQCFDLAVAFTDFLGIPHYPGNPSPFPYANACQIYTDFGDFQKQYFDRISNTPDYIPQKGDIVIWDAELNGGAGHVAIATGEGDANTFNSFDQNWSTTNWIPKIVNHNYDLGPVLGCLRLKVTQPSTQPTMDNNWKQILDYAKGKFLVNEAKDVIKYIEDLDAYRKSESAEKDKKQREIEALQIDNGKLSEQIDIWIKAITAEGLDPQNFQSSLHELLAKKDDECKKKIQAIQDIPPKVITKTVEMPYQFNKAVYKAMDEFIKYIDKHGIKLPVSGDVRK